jgi:hypothetical protein
MAEYRKVPWVRIPLSPPSASVATSWLSRDERFMYFSVAFLILADFAFGFAAKQTAKP